MNESIKTEIEWYVTRLVQCNNGSSEGINFTKEDESQLLMGAPFYLDAVDMFQLCSAIEQKYHITIPGEFLLKNKALTIDSLSEVVICLINNKGR